MCVYIYIYIYIYIYLLWLVCLMYIYNKTETNRSAQRELRPRTPARPEAWRSVLLRAAPLVSKAPQGSHDESNQFTN